MKRGTSLLIGALSFWCVSGAAALAADLGPSRRAVADQMPSLWQGWYGGLSLGVTSSGVDVEKFGKKDDADISGNSVGLGAFAGVNVANGPWIFGLEADINGGGFDDKKTIAGLGTVTAEANAFGSVRFRTGYAWDRWMVYGSAGLAIADLEIKSSLGGKESLVSTGLAVGLGTEYAISENWRARAEGLVYMFDDKVELAGAERDVNWGHATFRLGAVRRF